ncbi:hypothetical protein C5167_050029 [Papaver somniferum]|uniref:F-box domain-containing protein n=1 Tax=Papaver somniferum TaxID=3469 RepID=A0A4Y7KQ85_PAPSO|nr:F-box protein SKIP14-like isoform X1 [Papaver somniferum]RZC74552.1 hypothetical protein C5167_050029 [Papaver somniferum]
MTLNFSRRVFPSKPLEENSGIKIGNGYAMDGGFSEKNVGVDGYVRAHHCHHYAWDFLGNSFDSGKDIRGGGDRVNSLDRADILDILPADPFGMSATFTAAITGWIEDFETFETDSLSFIWNSAMKIHSDNEGGMMNERLNNSSCRFGERTGEEFLSLDNGDTRFDSNHREAAGEIASAMDIDGGCPEGLLFALSYLNSQDLLSVERVCKLLRSTIQGDALLWRDIHIDQPLSERITDDGLLQLASRAQGSLRTLSLVKCSRITDDGLKRVLESNPTLIKLNVPGCTKLTVEGIVKSLKTFKSTSTPGIKQLRVGGRYDVTQIHFEELMSLIGADGCKEKSNVLKPRFYGQYSLPCDDDCAMDIEACPKCQMFRMVYDCPAESCQGKKMESQLCRACKFCISRCYQCGRCINGIEYEETFCLEPLCSGCWKQVMNCQETRYCLRLFG